MLRFRVATSKPQTLDPQLSLQQFQVQGAGWMVNHRTPFRVSHVFHFRVAVLIDLGLLKYLILGLLYSLI